MTREEWQPRKPILHTTFLYTSLEEGYKTVRVKRVSPWNDENCSLFRPGATTTTLLFLRVLIPPRSDPVRQQQDRREFRSWCPGVNFFSKLSKHTPFEFRKNIFGYPKTTSLKDGGRRAESEAVNFYFLPKNEFCIKEKKNWIDFFRA